MGGTDERAMVKKSVVLHPIMDDYIRKTWALLIDGGHDATYSMALNFMLLAAVMEGAKEGGFSEETLETLQDFLGDQDVLQRLNLHESLGRLREFWGLDH